MSVAPEGHDAVLFSARRAAFARALGERPALIPAGAAPSRNYLATRYAFRATSHFLHLTGRSLSGAMLVYDGDGFTLYAIPPSDDDALWHGPSPSLGALAESMGLPVKPLHALTALPAETGCIPVRDLATLRHVQGLLGRVASEPPTDPRDVALAHALVSCRLAHDAFAIAEIARTLSVTARAFDAGFRATPAARSMREVRAAMLHVFEAEGLAPAYGPIVTTHGEVLHSEDSSEAVAHDALVLADVGAESAHGYATDITRTWPVRRASETQASLLALVRSAQAAAIAQVAPGVRYRDVHVAAATKLAEGLVALGVFTGDPVERVMDGTIALVFPHGIGHLLGLDVHDMEDLGDIAGYGDGFLRDPAPTFRYLRLDRILRPGMAVTIEPGLYFVPALVDDPANRRSFAGRVRFDVLDRFRDVRGIRIEDDVLVTDSGRDVLSRAIAHASSDG